MITLTSNVIKIVLLRRL